MPPVPSESSAPRTARAAARAELTRTILDRAGQLLGEVGPAALSLRQVSRDLEMASSALYRYFPSRDALLTALIVEAYDELGAVVEVADTAVQRDHHAARFHAACGALRDWAREHPHRWALVYGSPVPGYTAPQDTVPAATRVTGVLLSILADAQGSGGEGPRHLPVSRSERAALVPVMESTDPPLLALTAARGVAAWATLVGQVSLELFGHLHRGVLDYDAHFEQLVQQLVSDLGLT